MKISRSVETLADLKEFVSMCEASDVPPDAKIKARASIGGYTKELSAETRNAKKPEWLA
jgi:hypothetical protein